MSGLGGGKHVERRGNSISRVKTRKTEKGKEAKRIKIEKKREGKCKRYGEGDVSGL